MAIGFDTDPLAVLIAKAWCSDVDEEKLERAAKEIVNQARKRYSQLSLGEAYPRGGDSETRKFVRFWFDDTNRRQLAALSDTIHRFQDPDLNPLMWCAFSRLIITKRKGASLAMDVSHSRPHRVYIKAPIKALEQFPLAVKAILKAAPFKKSNHRKFPQARIQNGDARRLPIEDESVDMVITSPPYLNAIDYLRGHKLSLVWMGYTVGTIRDIRASNIGTETQASPNPQEQYVAQALDQMGRIGQIPERFKGMLMQYVLDMNACLREIKRVLTKRGQVVLIVGDSTLQGVFVRNSKVVEYLGKQNGLFVRSNRRRELPENRRYLPPPTLSRSGAQLRNRMREEAIITFSACA